ncbi:unnamed protein product [Notodromas monacha]|uniref:RING-type domain-containing protein n=1 Tax=Notodromas monacha TaxID=399045 RepID=A0A7R9BE10_9CRUS|nr:unnamed protein product [Notodromas monacha]CAG0913662.1 unnamed protein product [Notodromas monacha]
MPNNDWDRFLGIVLRVPSLFVLDELFRAAFGVAAYYSHWENEETLGDSPGLSAGNETLSEAKNLTREEVRDGVPFLSIAFPFILSLLLHAVAGIAACVVFLLRIQKLKTLYLFVACCVSTFISYQLNLRLITRVLASDQQASVFRSLLCLQVSDFLNPASINNVILTTFWLQVVHQQIFIRTYKMPCSCNFGNLEKLAGFSLLLPPFLVAILPPNHSIISQLPIVCAWTAFCLLNYSLIVGIAGIYRTTLRPGYQCIRRSLRNNTLAGVLQIEFIRLQVPDVLQLFWIMRAIAYTISYGIEKMESGSIFAEGWSVSFAEVEEYLKAVMAHGCDTIIAVLSMSSMVHTVCYAIGLWFHSFLQINDDEQKSIGIVLSVLFFILAMQTGLTGLSIEKRVVRLCRNFCLVFTALLHFVHRMVNPILQSLSASRTSVSKHVRPLAVASFLLVVPILMLTWLWTNFKLSTWLLAVSAFSLEVVVKILGTLTIYALFLIDAHQNTYWENLDDYVYYIKALGSAIEFMFGVFLFLNGTWILLFESGGAIRTCMMCIHAYFNIWLEARNGWDAFNKRRTALGKINSLPDATPNQLSVVNDVCAICYQNMDHAKVTQCGHFFHGNCLRKWLYMQDKCPMCHEVLYGTGGREEKERPDNEVVQENPEQVQ